MGSAETYQALCDQVLKNTDLQGGSPFAAKLGDILKEHPFISSFQESDTQRELLFAFAADIFLDEAVTQFFTEQKDSMSNTLDIIKLGDLYRQIEAIVGEPYGGDIKPKTQADIFNCPPGCCVPASFYP